MEKRFFRTLLVAFFAVTIACITFTGKASALIFDLKITNLSSNVLSPAGFVTHDSGYDLFVEGQPASQAVEDVAERGDNTQMLLDALASLSVLDAQSASNGPLMTGMSATALINADPSHPFLTFASMMGVSNDGWIGGSTGDGAIDLFSGVSPIGGVYDIVPYMVWDAGTEVNDEANGSVGALGFGNGGIDENYVIFRPHEGIRGDVDVPASFDWSNDAVIARIEVTPTPIPAPILLLGTGLVGLSAFRKKKSLKK